MTTDNRQPVFKRSDEVVVIHLELDAETGMWVAHTCDEFGDFNCAPRAGLTMADAVRPIVGEPYKPPVVTVETPNGLQPRCGARNFGFQCTMPIGHKGKHKQVDWSGTTSWGGK